MSLTMIFGASITSLADDSAVNLQTIANQTVLSETYEDENGNIVTTYSDLDIYINNVQAQYPDISDYELAISVYKYTGQEYDGLPESVILNILDLDNITITDSYILVNQDGTASVSSYDAVPYADWTSSDGYMKISTGYSLLGTSGSEKRYSVWSMAKWLKYPAMALQDVFVLSTNGTFDDSYEENFVVSQTFKCTVGCANPYTYYVRTANTSKPQDFDLELEYKNYVPLIRFIPISPRCDYCQGPASDHFFMAYITYGVVTNRSINLQAGYAHKTLGFGDISISIDATGNLGFSIAPTAKISEYIARPVTIQF